MKTKIVIENGHTEIILTPENSFDTDVLEKIYSDRDKFDIKTKVLADYNYGSHQNHRFVMNIVAAPSQPERETNV